ncbi:murein hydrolase activator EnvC family protein [Thermaerobacter marianensis]|nr:M23 family metallopeptidase [Thermaerobacter marianensis]
MPGAGQGSAWWIPVFLAVVLVAGRWLPGAAGDAWARAAEGLVTANWLDRPQVARWMEWIPGGGWLQVAVLGREQDGAGGAGAEGAGAPGASVPALAPVAPDPAGAGATGAGGSGPAGLPGEDPSSLPGSDPAGRDPPALQGAPGAAGAGGAATPGVPAAGGSRAGAGLPGGGASSPPAGSGGTPGGNGAASATGPAGTGPAGPGGAGPSDDTAGGGGGSGSGGGTATGEGDARSGAAGGGSGGAGPSGAGPWEPGWRWPVTGRVTEPFGWQLDDGDAPRFHEGIDIAARAGTAVRAAAGGVVTRVWYDRAGLGWMVEVDHGGGWATRYAAVDHVVVRDRDVVTAGQVLAAVAAEGEGAGPHLHFEMRRRGQAVDPELHLPPPEA